MRPAWRQKERLAEVVNGTGLSGGCSASLVLCCAGPQPGPGSNPRVVWEVSLLRARTAGSGGVTTTTPVAFAEEIHPEDVPNMLQSGSLRERETDDQGRRCDQFHMMRCWVGPEPLLFGRLLAV